MHAEEFREEIHEYIDNAYTQFQEFQKQHAQMYKVFHEICKRNSIHCYYGFGSLLGIIRDNGTIPWDADIDVLIPVSEAKKLIAVLQKELPDDYYIISNFIDKNYYLCESRICKKGYDSEVMHIDIFYLIGAPSDPKTRNQFDKRVKHAFCYRAIRNGQITDGIKSKSKFLYFLKKVRKALMHIEPDFLFNKRCNDLLFKYEYSSSEYCIVWAVGGEIFPVSIFEPRIIYELDGFECYLPNNSDEFLKIRYADYEHYLPISARFDEFYSGFKRLLKLYGDNKSEIK